MHLFTSLLLSHWISDNINSTKHKHIKTESTKSCDYEEDAIHMPKHVLLNIWQTSKAVGCRNKLVIFKSHGMQRIKCTVQFSWNSSMNTTCSDHLTLLDLIIIITRLTREELNLWTPLSWKRYSAGWSEETGSLKICSCSQWLQIGSNSNHYRTSLSTSGFNKHRDLPDQLKEYPLCM